jgi:predicted nucleic-acid-binding protein
VLRRVYRFDDGAITTAIRALLNTRNVVMNRPAVEAGLALLGASGDFADGVMAHEGARLGGETFVSFDRKAVSLLLKRGKAARLLAPTISDQLSI